MSVPRIYGALKQGSGVVKNKKILFEKIPFPAIRLKSSSGEILSFDSLRETKSFERNKSPRNWKIIEYKARTFPTLHYHSLHNNQIEKKVL